MPEEFLRFLKDNDIKIFIEAEAKEGRMQAFIQRYNEKYSQQINLLTDGICVLGDVDKWGVELRIYLNTTTNMPDSWRRRKYRTSHYRSDTFKYRLDDNKLVKYLFDNGYRIGSN